CRLPLEIHARIASFFDPLFSSVSGENNPGYSHPFQNIIPTCFHLCDTYTTLHYKAIANLFVSKMNQHNLQSFCCITSPGNDRENGKCLKALSKLIQSIIQSKVPFFTITKFLDATVPHSWQHDRIVRLALRYSLDLSLPLPCSVLERATFIAS